MSEMTSISSGQPLGHQRRVEHLPVGDGATDDDATIGAVADALELGQPADVHQSVDLSPVAA